MGSQHIVRSEGRLQPLEEGVTAPADPGCEGMQHAVARVLASPTFQRTPRLTQLLEYLADHTARGDIEALKEATIGQHLFGRLASYSAAEDNIVRSNVRHLRMKLGEYYTTDGAGETCQVVIPKGSYAVTVQDGVPVAGPVCPEPVPSPVAARKPVRVWLLVAVAAALGCTALGFALFRPRKAPDALDTHRVNCLLDLLSPGPGQRLLVVVPDANLQLYKRLTGEDVSLQDYIDHRFPRPEALARRSPALARSADALFHGSTTQAFVLDLLPTFARILPSSLLSVRTPDALSVKDFDKDSALLISGPYADPWVQMFDRKLNFQIQDSEDKPPRTQIVNREPRGSEKKTYDDFRDAAGTTVCYGRVAYLPGRNPGSRVLLAGGPHLASTDSACAFVTRAESLRALRNLLNLKVGGQMPWFELLIEARAFGDAPWTMQVLSYRLIDSNPR